jgi:hypothetical protein
MLPREALEEISSMGRYGNARNHAGVSALQRLFKELNRWTKEELQG